MVSFWDNLRCKSAKSVYEISDIMVILKEIIELYLHCSNKNH